MNTKIKIAGVTMKNPVMTASGTFGSGIEYSAFLPLERLGAVVTKGVAAEPWAGNQTPRVAETPAGMLNAIGLQNPGAETFLERDLPFLKDRDTRVIVNVCGHTEEEYIRAVELLSAVAGIDLLEINISCPNVKAGGITFGTDPKSVFHITKTLRKHTGLPLIMKLSPNVTSITEIARAAAEGGADALSLINTLTGMKIDIEKQDFVLANKTGGLSGPAVHPVAVRMVYEVTRAVSLPVIGMGGVETAEDAVELLLAGATAVAVGTAGFRNPNAAVEIIDGIEAYLLRKKIDDVNTLRRLLA